MTTLEAVAAKHARDQKRLAERTAKKLAAVWRKVDPGNISRSWYSFLPEAFAIVASGQIAAGVLVDDYVDRALLLQDIDPDRVGSVQASRLAGVASDGRNLTSLLYQPAVATLTDLQRGGSVAHARAAGLLKLDVIGRTQVADAGRGAESVAIAARRRVTGYVRMLSRPSCSRCIVLAGKFYRWNTGFRRHPRCDCRHVPAREDSADDVRTDPRAAFDDLDEAQQDKVFTKAGAEAIRNGADISQVVNARRGMDTAVVFGQQVLHTREGVTRYGVAGRRLKSPVRLMPEQIFIEAKGNRAEAVRLLKLHGYIN